VKALITNSHVVFFYGIAALSVTFLLTAKRKVTKRKLLAAPASLKGSALAGPVVAEPDDANLRVNFWLCFCVISSKAGLIY